MISWLYMTAYSSNIAIDTATVTVAGTDAGNYRGASGTATFQIVGSSTNSTNLTVTVNPAQAPVNGDNPAISVAMGSIS